MRCRWRSFRAVVVVVVCWIYLCIYVYLCIRVYIHVYTQAILLQFYLTPNNNLTYPIPSNNITILNNPRIITIQYPMPPPKFLNMNIPMTFNPNKTLNMIIYRWLVIKHNLIIIIIWDSLVMFLLLRLGIEQNLLNFILIVRLCKPMIIIKILLNMNTIKLKLYIRTIILLSQLKIQLILPNKDLGGYFFLCPNLREFPINNTNPILIPQK